MGKIVGKLDGLFFNFLIPLVITIGFIFISLAIFGYDMKDLPIVNTFISDKVNASEKTKGEETPDELGKVKKLLAQKEKSYNQLHQKYLEQQNQLNQLHAIAKQTGNQTDDSKSEQKKAYKELSKVYLEMTPKKAAAILENLETSEAALLLNEMSVSQQGDLLSSMSSEKASKISLLLKEEIEKSANTNEW